jgi:hypothetical protein
MVPSLMLAIAIGVERLSCGDFSLDETIHFGSLEFIANRFRGLSLSPIGDGSDAIVMGSARGEPPSLQQTMMGDSAEGFPTALDGEGRTNLPSPRRYGVGAPLALATTIPRS